MNILINFISYILIGVAIDFAGKEYLKRINFYKMVEKFQINKYDYINPENADDIYGMSNGLDLAEKISKDKVSEKIVYILSIVLWPISFIFSMIALKLFEKYSK